MAGNTPVLIDRRSNCFNLIRLMAALQVFLAHVGRHLKISMPSWLGVMLNFFQGVPIFFMLSGFLIWDSVGRSKTYGQYLKKRFWRVYPELWLGVAVEMLALILFYGRHMKFLDSVLFAFGQATIFQFWTPDSLRAYGCGTPNGSLWTIGVTVQFYIVIWFIYRWLHRDKNNARHHEGQSWFKQNRNNLVRWFVFFGASVLLSMVGKLAEGLPTILIKLYNQTFIPYLFLFLIGAFLAEYGDEMLWALKKYFYVFIIVAVFIFVVDADLPLTTYKVFRNIFLICGVIGFAYRFPKLNLKIDISYGLFIHHMTVVNVMIELSMIGNYEYLFIALAFSVAVAFVSTLTIGKMSQRKKVTAAK